MARPCKRWRLRHVADTHFFCLLRAWQHCMWARPYRRTFRYQMRAFVFSTEMVCAQAIKLGVCVV